MIELFLKLVDRLIDLCKERKEVNRAIFVDFVSPAFEIFEKVHADYIDSLTRYSTRLADPAVPMDWNHPVFRDMELDSLKSEHLRAKLRDFNPKTAPQKLQSFLTALDFYLRGMASSGSRAEVVDNIAARSGMSIAEMEAGLGGQDFFAGQPKETYAYWRIANPDPRNAGPEGLIFSDPMRVALHEQLAGFDAPPGEDIPWGELVMSLTLSDIDRRRLCAHAIRIAMQHFQRSYAVVSSGYSSLRSELLAPT